MSKTKIERAIELHYQNCHIPVLCKNKSYADAATGNVRFGFNAVCKSETG